MGNSLNQRIKECLTITVKFTFFLLLIINISCRNINKQYFKVFGDEDLLKDININILEYNGVGKKWEGTLMHNRNKYDVESLVEIGAIYEVYISYKDSLVNILKFENVMRNANDNISHLYIAEEANKILVTYIGRESNIINQKGVNILLIPEQEFYKINDDEIKTYKNIFFNKF